jgi:cytosine/adenosine deaminase-related metal-dependent hydrolase
MTRYLLTLTILLVSGCAQVYSNVQSKNVASEISGVFDGSGYPVEVCDSQYAGHPASCTISGSGSSQIIRGNIISNGKIYIGGELLVGDDGHIKAAGCHLPQESAITLDCPGSLISAGFINLHEHIDYSYQQPPHPPTLKWEHRDEWRRLSAAERGFEGDAPKDEEVRIEVSERAMLRHALSGSTSISGAKEYRAFLRNLKLDNGSLATPFGKSVIDSTFPLDDGKSKQWLTAPCTPDQITAIEFNKENPFIPHVGEGINDGARYEVDCVLDAIQTKTTPNAFIHGVAIDDTQVERLKSQKVAVVLSPRSNFQLYGATAPVSKLKEAGVTLAMGTDWSPSGSLTQLDEVRCLARYNHDTLNGLFSWSDMHRMMTENGAKAVGLQGQIGKLAIGEYADIVILDTDGRRSLGDVLENSALHETIAVFIGGKAASFPVAWESKLPTLDKCSLDSRNLCGQTRIVCGADSNHNLNQLLKQATYSIDDTKICTPQPTDDCVELMTIGKSSLK